MAKKSTKREEDKKLDITDVDYKDVKELKLWNSKYEFDTVSEIRKRFFELLLSRRTSCFYAQVPNLPTISEQDIINYNSGSTWESGGTGSNWNHRWNFVGKSYLMWKRYIEGLSNVKSPLTFATIEAMVSEFVNNSATISLMATKLEDTDNVRIMQEYLRRWEQEKDISYAKLQSFRRTALYGTGFTFNPYVQRSHKKEIILGAEEASEYISELRKSKEESDKKKAEYLQSQLDKEKPVTREEIIVDWNDPAIIPVNIFEIYPDNHASRLQGPYREANDLVWRRVYGMEQLKAEFEDCNDPYVISSNVKRVRPVDNVNEVYGIGEIFFKVPSDLATTKGKVEVMHYYNKAKDKYVVTANDILLRDGPMPYNHGEIPFSRHTIIDFDDQMYGIGIADQVESLQAVDETMFNMHIETKKIGLNPPIVVNKQNFDDFDQQYNRIEAGQKLEGVGDIGPNSLRWFEGPNSSAGDIISLRRLIDEDVTKASGVNDLAYAVQSSPNEAVRNNMQAMESTYKIIKARTRNWSMGYRESVRQILALLAQYAPEKYDEEKESHSLVTQDIQIVKYDDDSVEIQDVPGTHHFELESKYFSVESRPQVTIDVDSMLPISANMKVARSEQVLNVLPLLTNPQLMNDPLARKLIKDYFKQHGYDSTVMDLFNDDDKGEEDKLLAEEQIAMILDGKDVPAEPGVSDTHLLTEALMLFKLQGEVIELQADQNTPIGKYNKKVEDYNRLLVHYQGDVEGRKQLITDTATAKPLEPRQPQLPPEAMGQTGLPPMMPAGPTGLPPGVPAQLSPLVAPPIAPQALM